MLISLVMREQRSNLIRLHAHADDHEATTARGADEHLIDDAGHADAFEEHAGTQFGRTGQQIHRRRARRCA